MFKSGKVLDKPWQVAHHQRGEVSQTSASLDRWDINRLVRIPSCHGLAQMQLYQNGSAGSPVPHAWVWVSPGSSCIVSDSCLTKLLASWTTTCKKVAYIESVSQNEAVVLCIHNMLGVGAALSGFLQTGNGEVWHREMDWQNTPCPLTSFFRSFLIWRF